MFGKNPLAWLLLLFTYYLLVGIAEFGPWARIGQVVAPVLKPLFTVGFLAAAWTQERGGNAVLPRRGPGGGPPSQDTSWAFAVFGSGPPSSRTTLRLSREGGRAPATAPAGPPCPPTPAGMMLRELHHLRWLRTAIFNG